METDTMTARHTGYVAGFHLDGARPTDDARHGTLALQAHCRVSNASH